MISRRIRWRTIRGLYSKVRAMDKIDYKLNVIKRIYGFDAYHSLSSKVRRKILSYLKGCQEGGVQYKATIYDISKNIKVSYENTKGAIMGNVRGYNKNRSLLNVGFIACEKKGDSFICSLTSNGLDVTRLLDE